MPASSRPLSLLLVALLALAPAIGDARRHGHGHGHHGWMHARLLAVRGWFRHARDPGGHEHRGAAHRSRAASQAHAVEQAALAARRRSEVDAYLRDHPVFIAAE
jgi:hypothetical protein